MMARILLADDDIELSGMLVDYFTAEGFDVDVAYDGVTTLNKISADRYDLLILDVMMPHRNGFDVLRELRMQSLLPVLRLTARGNDIDSIVGLELGADDYLAKPSNPRVMVARIRAILRRAEIQGDRPMEAVSLIRLSWAILLCILVHVRLPAATIQYL
jgi:two-component system response regulator CpxR